MSKEILIQTKLFAKLILRTALFYVRLFPLVELLLRFVDKKNINKKGDASQ